MLIYFMFEKHVDLTGGWADTCRSFPFYGGELRFREKLALGAVRQRMKYRLAKFKVHILTVSQNSFPFSFLLPFCAACRKRKGKK